MEKKSCADRIVSEKRHVPPCMILRLFLIGDPPKLSIYVYIDSTEASSRAQRAHPRVPQTASDSARWFFPAVTTFNVRSRAVAEMWPSGWGSRAGSGVRVENYRGAVVPTLKRDVAVACPRIFHLLSSASPILSVVLSFRARDGRGGRTKRKRDREGRGGGDA